MDRQQMERCLQRVAAYRAFGQKANVWAQANGWAVRELASWCAHAARWQARLDGVGPSPARKTQRFRSRPRRVECGGVDIDTRLRQEGQVRSCLLPRSPARPPQSSC